MAGPLSRVTVENTYYNKHALTCLGLGLPEPGSHQQVAAAVVPFVR